MRLRNRDCTPLGLAFIVGAMTTFAVILAYLLG